MYILFYVKFVINVFKLIASISFRIFTVQILVIILLIFQSTTFEISETVISLLGYPKFVWNIFCNKNQK